MALPTSLKNILNNSIVEQARVEYKRDWNPKTILHTICAFVNDIDNFSGGYRYREWRDRTNIIITIDLNTTKSSF